MSETNTIYDANWKVVAVFRHGVAWSRLPPARLGEYDEGDEGSIVSNDGDRLGSFANGRVLASDGSLVGSYVEAQLPSPPSKLPPLVGAQSFVKRLEIGQHVVGWCIGKPGAAAAAILLLLAKE